MGLPVKIVTFVIQAALVILAVFLFSYFDPFNIFNSKKLTLKDTPVIVEGIRGIGQLITAEYYGEVIKSSTETMEIQLESQRSSAKNRLIKFELMVRHAADTIQDEGDTPYNNRRQLYRAFKRSFPSILSNPDYKIFLELASSVQSNEKQVLFNYYNDGIFFPASGVNSYEARLDAYLARQTEYSKAEKREISRNSLILLGRGWIKAGIDFSNFDEKHFQYFPDRNLVRLIHHEAAIISKTINPWFIPEMKMKGFEFIFVGRKIDANPDSEQSVKAITGMKQACLDNLEADAKKANILGKAHSNAEVTLGHFLSLLMGKEIKVEIYKHPLDAALHDIMNSKRITSHDLAYLDSLVGEYATNEFVRTLEFLKEVNDSIRKKSVVASTEMRSNSNWEVVAVYERMAADGFYTALERDSITRYLAHADSQKITNKEICYQVVTDSNLTSRIIKGEIALKDKVDSLNILIGKIKMKQLDKLKADLEKLRSVLSPNELFRSDYVVDSLLRLNEISKAYDYAKAVETYGLRKAGWRESERNWQISAIATSVMINGSESPLLKVDLAKIQREPSGKEYFYYLFYEGRIPDMLMKNPDVLKRLLRQQGDYRKIDPVLTNTVEAYQKVNVDSLCALLKREKINVPRLCGTPAKQKPD